MHTGFETSPKFYKLFFQISNLLFRKSLILLFVYLFLYSSIIFSIVIYCIFFILFMSSSFLEKILTTIHKISKLKTDVIETPHNFKSVYGFSSNRFSIFLIFIIKFWYYKTGYFLHPCSTFHIYSILIM